MIEEVRYQPGFNVQGSCRWPRRPRKGPGTGMFRVVGGQIYGF